MCSGLNRVMTAARKTGLSVKIVSDEKVGLDELFRLHRLDNGAES